MDQELIDICETRVVRTLQRYRLTSDPITLETVARQIVADIAKEMAEAKQRAAA